MFKYVGIAVLAGVALIASLGSSPQTFRIRFAAVVGSVPFRCGQTYHGVGSGRADVTAQYFRFYVSQVKLVTSDGRRVPLDLDQDGTWQRRDVAFLSFEDAGTNCANGSPQKRDEIVGTAPPGSYDGIEFTLGVPDDLDHADATIAQSPLNLSDMFWSWQDGYKFLRFDARVNGGGRSAAYIFHLGSTGCALSDRIAHCASPNRTIVVLKHFDPRSRRIVADLASLYRDADLVALGQRGGCMSNAADACQPVMRDLGVAFLGRAAGPQRLFTVR